MAPYLAQDQSSGKPQIVRVLRAPAGAYLAAPVPRYITRGEEQIFTSSFVWTAIMSISLPNRNSPNSNSLPSDPEAGLSSPESSSDPLHTNKPQRRKTIYNKKPFATAPWLGDEPLRNELPQHGDPWENCLGKVKDFDDDLCKAWRDEVDKLLIFAGLFFAAVTAFVIESYAFLQEDPQDRNTFLLEQILLETRNANAGLPPTNPLPAFPPFSPSASTVRINVVWFLSLSLALGTVLLGILCLQWLREYQRNIPLDPKEALSLRQMRYDGLIKWKVPEMLTSLPVLLNTSLLLFFWGLLELLWSLNTTVAVTTTIIVGVFTLIVVFTTIVPTAQLFWINPHLRAPQCAWKSPQAWATHRIVTNFIILIRRTSKIFRKPGVTQLYKHFRRDKDWSDYDEYWRKARQNPSARRDSKIPSDIAKALAWADRNLGGTLEMVTSVYHCLKTLDYIPSIIRTLGLINDRIATHLSDNEIGHHLTDDATRTILAALYLEENNNAFPQLDLCRAETVIRALNTQLATPDVPGSPVPDSPLALSQASLTQPSSSAIVLPFIHWPVLDTQHLPLDMLFQALQAVLLMIQRNVFPDNYLKDALFFTGGVCTRLLDISEKGGKAPRGTLALKELTSEVVASLNKYDPSSFGTSLRLLEQTRSSQAKLDATTFEEGSEDPKRQNLSGVPP